MTAVTGLKGKGTFAGGIHPPERKEPASDAAIEALPVPGQVVIPLLQHLGAACEPVVSSREELSAGQRVGSSEAFIAAPVHTPVAGVAAKSTAVTVPTGRRVEAVPVKSAENNVAGEALIAEVLGGEWATVGLERHAPDDITGAAKDKGLVGMGGAGFPTYIKLTRNEERPVDTLLVNGCECEPYLTADYRLMVEFPSPIVSGALLAARACGAETVMIVVEDNKLLAVETLRGAAEGTGIAVTGIHTKYPQGGEKQLVAAAMDRTVPDGGLPLDVGVVVINVATAAALAGAVLRDRPLTHRVVCVTGGGIERPANVLCPVGAPLSALIEHCGGLKSEAVRVVVGGPMMGFAVGDLATPITKITGGVTVLTEREIAAAPEVNCIRCGRCVKICPMNLVPTRIALAARGGHWDLAEKYAIDSCMECGSCGYVCPSSIPLVQLIRMGKALKPRE